MSSTQLFVLTALCLVAGVLMATTSDQTEMAAALVGAAIGAVGGRASARTEKPSSIRPTEPDRRS